MAGNVDNATGSRSADRRRRLVSAFLLCGLVATSASFACAGDDPKDLAATKPSSPATTAKSKPGVPTQAELEKEFETRMTGSVLVGSFTIDGSTKPPHAERYAIDKVTKLGGEVWLFQSRIQYMDKDVSVPIPITVKWAGDTPMIVMTDFAIPGMKGKFTSRVVFYRDRYAGTWQHDAVGGHMFGMIEKAKPAADGKPAPEAKPTPGPKPAQ